MGVFSECPACCSTDMAHVGGQAWGETIIYHPSIAHLSPPLSLRLTDMRGILLLMLLAFILTAS